MNDAAPSLSEVLPTLSADERASILDYITIMRGRSLLDRLGDEDRADLQRRASTIDPATSASLDTVVAQSLA